MLSLSIWHWLILLFIVAGIGGVIYTAYRTSRRKNGELKGFGGWLILLAIGVYLSPFKTIINFG